MSIFSSGSERTQLIKKNIIASFGLRIISIICSLMVVPITIDYVNPEQYGIWLTLSSIVVWLSYFDFGFAHGFRNRFAEAIANEDIALARSYVSTTYFVLAILFSVVMLGALVLNSNLNWSEILNVNPNLNVELRGVFQILIVFFCVNIVGEVFSTMLTAYQRPAFASAVKTGGYVLSLFVIFILTKTTSGSLEWLAYASSGIPCLLTILVSVFVFHKGEYKQFAPSFQSIKLSLSKNIVGMGAQFFLIMLCILFIFQFVNIIISRELGPESVTLYNVTYKIFGVVEMVMMIILTPIWSAYTDAYTKGDGRWMQTISLKLSKSLIFLSVCLLVLWIVSPFVFELWLGGTVRTNIWVSAIVAIFVLSKIMGATYMYQINGTGKLRMQLVTYIIIAFFALPLMVLGGRLLGLVGIIVIPTLAFVTQYIVMKIQLQRIIDGTAKGWWNK